MAESLWDGVAAAYDRSFATLCSGTAPVLLEQIPVRSRVSRSSADGRAGGLPDLPFEDGSFDVVRASARRIRNP